MTRFLVSFALAASLAGCIDGTNPFDEEKTEATTATTQTTTTTPAATTPAATTPTETPATDTGTPIVSSVATLPGTANPTSRTSIFRSEAKTEGGDGFAKGFVYDSANDTFTVDNIAFDGDKPYTAVLRDDGVTKVGMGPFSVFEAPATATDQLTQATINQLYGYRALYAIGPGGDTSIAIVRNGAYIPYGYGGYVFQRDGDVTLPTSGQAFYTGTNNYGGLRDFEGRGGLEYVKGDIQVAIDFDDFNDGAGVNGVVLNRQVYDLTQVQTTPTLANPDPGNITQDILDAIGGGVTALPVLRFKIGVGALDANGELTGEVFSTDADGSGTFEDGNYYAILSGDNANTVTGIIVVTGTDPRYSNTKFRETAGFFAERK